MQSKLNLGVGDRLGEWLFGHLDRSFGNRYLRARIRASSARIVGVIPDSHDAGIRSLLAKQPTDSPFSLSLSLSPISLLYLFVCFCFLIPLAILAAFSPRQK